MTTLTIAANHTKRTATFSPFAMMERARQRRALAKLPAYRLADMGISENDAMAESAKAFWED